MANNVALFFILIKEIIRKKLRQENLIPCSVSILTILKLTFRVIQIYKKDFSETQSAGEARENFLIALISLVPILPSSLCKFSIITQVSSSALNTQSTQVVRASNSQLSRSHFLSLLWCGMIFVVNLDQQITNCLLLDR